MSLVSTLSSLACLGIVSCAATSHVVQKSKDATTAGVAKFTGSLANLRKPGVYVVEVREKDLQEMPSGEERALAFTQQKKRNFWFFNGPVDFKEPALPESGAILDGSLLPPAD